MFKNILKYALLTYALVNIIGCSSTGKNGDQRDLYTDMSAEKIYNKAKNNIDNENYTRAITDLEALESRYPYGEYADRGQLALMYAYYKREEYPQALATAERFIRFNPRHKNADYVYYLKGLVSFDRNYSLAFRIFPIYKYQRDSSIAKEAFNDFKTLIEKYPNSNYSHDARRRMINLKNQIANHELHIAEKYYERKAYLAAANRAAFLVNQFDKTPAVPKALELMVTAYNKLEMYDSAKEAKATLEQFS